MMVRSAHEIASSQKNPNPALIALILRCSMSDVPCKLRASGLSRQGPGPRPLRPRPHLVRHSRGPGVHDAGGTGAALRLVPREVRAVGEGEALRRFGTWQKASKAEYACQKEFKRVSSLYDTKA
eukprot:50114-Hanusia_phi.AAC.1